MKAVYMTCCEVYSLSPEQILLLSLKSKVYQHEKFILLYLHNKITFLKFCAKLVWVIYNLIRMQVFEIKLFVLKVGQTLRSMSQGQNCWFPREGLIS